MLWIAAASALACQRAPAPPIEDKPMAAANDKPALVRLFDDAEACADRYQCAPLEALQQRAERPRETAVLEVAFDIMANPATATFERRFKLASTTARAWAAARTSGGQRMSIDDEQALRAQVNRLLARSDTALPAHGFVEYLSDARDIFEREALDPRRGNDEVHSAIRGLRDREPDLSTLRSWLASSDERPLIAGALLLDTFDHARLPTTDELPLLLAFARRSDTTPSAASLVAQHSADHADPAFAPVLQAFAQHPDASVRAVATQALQAAPR